MTQPSSPRRLLLALVLLLSLSVIPVVNAQDAEPGDTEIEEAIDDTTVDTEVIADEEEAQEIEGEESGVEDDSELEEEPLEEAERPEEVEEATNPLVPLGINTGFLLAQIVNFVIIALLLGAGLWRPLVNMLDSRGAKIQKGLEDAAAAANARRNAEAEAEKILAAARADAARVVEEARARGEDLSRQIELEATNEAERIRAEGALRASEERDRQLADLRGQVAAISIAVAERLIGANLDAKRQQALVNDFFTKMPAGKLDLQGPVEVITAMPLTDDERARIQRELGNVTATFTVDPDILGGVIIRSQDRVVDASVRSGLSEMTQRLR